MTGNALTVNRYIVDDVDFITEIREYDNQISSHDISFYTTIPQHLIDAWLKEPEVWKEKYRSNINTEDIHFRFIPGYDKSKAFINLKTMTITLTNRLEQSKIIECINHEYLHAILFKITDLETSHCYDNICSKYLI